MEADLTQNANDDESPNWHADVLRKREQRVAEGKERFIDWEDAKKELRTRLS